MARWSLLLLASALPAQERITVRCGNGVDARTPGITSARGLAVSLLAHTEDDHGKNTHLCQSSFRFAVTSASPPGVRSSQWDGLNDDSWGRKIVFSLSGLSQDGRRAFGFVVESGRYLEVLTFNLDSGIFQVQALAGSAFRALTPACRSTLGVVGTLPGGEAVFGAASTPDCQKPAAWQILPATDPSGNSKLRLLPPGSAFAPLDRGARAGQGSSPSSTSPESELVRCARPR